MSVETGRFTRHLGAVEVQKETRARNRPSGVTSTAGDESSQDKCADEERIKLPAANEVSESSLRKISQGGRRRNKRKTVFLQKSTKER